MRRAAVWVVVASVFAVARPPAMHAQDRPSAVVLEFEGPEAGLARRAVVNGVSKLLKLLPRRRVQSTATRLDVSWNQQADRARIARHLNIDLFVMGTVRQPRRGGLQTRLRVVDVEGTELAEIRTGSPRGNAGRRRVRQAAVDVVRQALRGWTRPSPPPESAPEPAPQPVEPEVVPEPEPEETVQTVPPSAPPEEPPAEADPGELAPMPASRRAPRAPRQTSHAAADEPLLRVLVGFRYSRYTTSAGVDGGGLARRFVGSLWELAGQVRLQPFARSRAWPRRLRVEADASHSVGAESTDPNGKALSTGIFRLAGEVGFDVTETPFVLSVLLGGGTEAFLVERNAVLPSKQTTFLQGHVRLTLPLVERTLRLEGACGGRWTPVVVGTERSLGSATAWGGEVSGGLFGDVGAFSYGAFLGFRRDRLTFRDGFGDGGHEQVLSGSVLVGWAY